MDQPLNLNDFVAGFVLESDEHLHSANRNLVAASEALKQGRPEPRAVRQLYRSLHTIKGIASMVGAEPIVDIAHEMESILRTADQAGGRLNDHSLDLLLQGTRALEERVHQVSKDGISGIAKAPAALLEALGLVQQTAIGNSPALERKLLIPDALVKGFSESDREQLRQGIQNGARAVIIEFQPSPEKAAQGINITSVRERLGAIGELVKVSPLTSATAPTGIAFALILVTRADDATLAAAAGLSPSEVEEIQLEAEQPAPPALDSRKQEITPIESSDAPEWMPNDHASVRVDIRRLDEALERLSDLIVTRSKLAKIEVDLSQQGVDTRELKTIISENSRQLKRLRTAITEARMVPLAELLQRLPLVVRGLTKDSDKTVNLVVRAGTSEVDKAVADKLFPAVVHLIRNAVDHAIEARSDREKAGKLAEGTLTVECDDSSGTSLVLTISDDGRGIDREAVAAKAGRAPARTDEELLQQIATPGLSTANQLTHTSGRGMGMEIVKRTVEQLGGKFSLTTRPGQGTVFTIRVPVSITIVDVLSFLSGDQAFVVPIAMVDEIIELDSARSVTTPVPTGSGPRPALIQRRGEAVPLLDLESILRPGNRPSTARKALVVNQHRGAVAFAVDRMLGQQEVVVRPLDQAFAKQPGISGATDLGDGQPTLVLDLSTLGAALLEESAGAS